MLDGIPVKELSASVLVGIAVLMVFVGLLVPRWVYKRLEKERDSWKLAYETERASRVTLEGQLVELLEIGRTSKNVLVGLHEASQRKKRTGGRESWESPGRVVRRNPERLPRRLWRMLSGDW